jgi:transposase
MIWQARMPYCPLLLPRYNHCWRTKRMTRKTGGFPDWKMPGSQPSSPPQANRKAQREYDKEMDKSKHWIANFFAKLKQFRGIATRYDKRASTFLGAIHLAAALIWLN